MDMQALFPGSTCFPIKIGGKTYFPNDIDDDDQLAQIVKTLGTKHDTSFIKDDKIRIYCQRVFR